MIDIPLTLSFLLALIVFEWVLKPIHNLLSQRIHRTLMIWRDTHTTHQPPTKEGN